MIGNTVSHYKILEHLGRGGMGLVYKAVDARLGRQIALKFLPEDFTQDTDALERFRREARIASSINHPHICTIYDIGEHNGQPFIAMELLVGNTLKELIANKKVSREDVVEYGVQIAGALDAAHAHGVLHRDIKPANIFVSGSGHVKLLDFGLAKPIGMAPEAPLTDSTLIGADITKPGQPVGTVLYMSPEQMRGETLDQRSDLFSFGVVLYEMATAQHPFPAKTLADVFDGILNRNPAPPVSLAPDVSPELQDVILKLLGKHREGRYPTAAEALSALRGLQRAPAAASKKQAWIAAAAIGLIGAVAFSSALFFWRPPDAGVALNNLSFQQLTTDAGEEMFPALAPDGRTIAYAGQRIGNWDIYLQRIGGQPINLTRESIADDTQPAFSPDGGYIVFRSERLGGGLFIMGATGESARRLTNNGFNPVWSPDGREVLFATERIVDNPNSRLGTSELWAADINTGATRLITKGDAVQPSWSTSGRIAYWAQDGGQRDIWTIRDDGTDPIRVTNDPHLDWNPVWSPGGDYLYFCSDRGGTTNIWRISMNPKSGEPSGEPHAVTTGGLGSRHHFSISRDGRLLSYVEAQVRLNLEKIRFNTGTESVEGEPVAITQGARWDSLPNASPDGEWLVFSSAGRQEDLFVIRTDGSDLRQLTNDSFKDRLPRWSPDGKRIGFYSNRGGDYSIWTLQPDGSNPQQLTKPGGAPPFPVWSPDSQRIAFRNGTDGSAILTLNNHEPQKEFTALPKMSETELFQVWSWSPDGKWLAGERVARGSETIGGIAIYSFDTGKFENLLDYGAAPVWLKDSRRLLFSSQNKIQLVDRVIKKTREVINASPKAIDITFDVSADNRVLYFTSIAREADVWLLTLP